MKLIYIQKKLEKKNKSNFESNLILGLFEFKKKTIIKQKFILINLKINFEHHLIFDPLKISLTNWSEIAIIENKRSIELINMPS